MTDRNKDEKGNLLLSFEEEGFRKRIENEMKSDSGLTRMFLFIIILQMMMAFPLHTNSKDQAATTHLLLSSYILQSAFFLTYVKGVGIPKKRFIQIFANGIGFRQEPKSWLFSADPFISFKMIEALVPGKDGELVIHSVLENFGTDNRLVAPEHQQEIIEAYENFKNSGS